MSTRHKSIQKITPFLWFDNQTKKAANFYTSIFHNSKVGRITRYGKEGVEVHGRPEGTVMTVEFQIEGQEEKTGTDLFSRLSWRCPGFFAR